HAPAHTNPRRRVGEQTLERCGRLSNAALEQRSTWWGRWQGRVPTPARYGRTGSLVATAPLPRASAVRQPPGGMRQEARGGGNRPPRARTPEAAVCGSRSVSWCAYPCPPLLAGWCWTTTRTLPDACCRRGSPLVEP